MTSKIGRFAIGLWLLANGLIMLKGCYEEKPIGVFTRMVNLTRTILDLSSIQRYADTIYTIMGGMYIALGVHMMHGSCFGSCLTVLLSILMALTFDNPLFSDFAGSEKKIMLICHLIVSGMAFSLCCCCTCSCCKKCEPVAIPKEAAHKEHIEKKQEKMEEIMPVKRGKKMK